MTGLTRTYTHEFAYGSLTTTVELSGLDHSSAPTELDDLGGSVNSALSGSIEAVNRFLGAIEHAVKHFDLDPPDTETMSGRFERIAFIQICDMTVGVDIDYTLTAPADDLHYLMEIFKVQLNMAVAQKAAAELAPYAVPLGLEQRLSARVQSMGQGRIVALRDVLASAAGGGIGVPPADARGGVYL